MSLHQLTDSPCIGVCSTLFDLVCKGCGRTQYEVDNWVFFNVFERQEARANAAERLQSIAKPDPIVPLTIR